MYSIYDLQNTGKHIKSILKDKYIQIDTHAYTILYFNLMTLKSSKIE